MRIRSAAFFVCLLFAPLAIAQQCETPVTVVPEYPTTRNAVTLHFRGYMQSCSTTEYEVRGNTILIDHKWNCLFTIMYGDWDVQIGTLPAGTYQVVFVRSFEDMTDAQTCGTFTVEQAPPRPPAVPLLSPLAVTALIAALARAAIRALT